MPLRRGKRERGRRNLATAYLIWLTGGFLALRRHYLKRHLTDFIFLLPSSACYGPTSERPKPASPSRPSRTVR
jgi:hypothetical protein